MKTPHRFRLFSPLAAFLLAACNSPAESVPPPPDGDELSIEWLQANAIPFNTTAPGGSTADLAPLGQIIGGARIVSLGEATHGSREFFDMKHRVLQYLVRERGFRAFAMEATWAEATRINHYVHTGEGDPEALLSNLYFWTWNTQEVLEMVRWMRQYNRDAPPDERVSFYGFDLQYSRVAMNDVEAYLAGVDAAAADSVREHYACYRRYQDEIQEAAPNYLAVPAATRAQCRAGVRAVHALVEHGAAAYASRSGRAAYETALRAARVVVQNEHLRTSPMTSTRDLYMAENVQWLAEVAEPEAGIVLWAHNAHVSRRAPYMGTHLEERFGGDYLVVGFSFHRGGLNAVQQGVGLQAHTAPPAAETSYEHHFNRLGRPRFFVDLRPVRWDGGSSEGTEWLRGPMSMRQVGSVYDPAQPAVYYADHRLAEEFDVVIHLAEVTPSRLLPFVYE